MGQHRGRTGFFTPAERTNRRIRLVCVLVWAVLLALYSLFVWRLGLRTSLLALACPGGIPLLTGETTPVQTPEQAPAPYLSIDAQTEPAAAQVLAREQEEPRILIYHTHATEAYFMTKADAYTPSGSWRTQNPEKSVVLIGRLLQETLEREYGLSVVHDGGNYEPPKLSTAYSRSLVAMESWRHRCPSLRVFIDVHRDAYGTGTDAPKDYVTIDGKETARIMCVVGTGEGATGSGFDQLPDFQANLALAERVTAQLRTVEPNLARDVRIKTGRYNQHVSNQCLLVEVGHNANTLEQARNAVPHLARAIAASLDNLAEAKGDVAWSPRG